MIGDPRFLEGVRWCINKREEIFGYGAAKKIDAKHEGEITIIRKIINDSDTN